MRKLFTTLFATLMLLLIYNPNLVQAQCGGVFADGFEAGNYNSWTAGTSNFTRSVVTTGTARGTYSFQQAGGFSNHQQGVSTTFTASTPTDVSWFVKGSSNSDAHAYVVIGGTNMTSVGNSAVFFYFDAQGNLCFYVSGSVNVKIAMTANTWYHVELKNINFTSQTYDIWVDGTLRRSAFPFRGSNANFNRIWLYNFHSGTTATYDDIIVGGVPLTNTFTANNVACPGDTNGTLSISTAGQSGPYAYLWSTGDSTNSIANLAAGTYQVTITDSLGCTDIDSATITEPTAITDSTVVTEPLCNGDSTGGINLTVSGGTGSYTYSWSNGDTIEDPFNIPAGTYIVTIMDSNNCAKPDTVVVGEPPLLTLNTTATPVNCPGSGNNDGTANVAISGGTPGYTTLWVNTQDTARNITGLSPGLYRVNVSDANGCFATDTVRVTEKSVMVVTGSPTDPLCNGDQNGMINLAVTGGTPTYMYNWSNGDTTANPSNLGSGTYTVVVTDSAGCTRMDTFNLTEPNPILASATVTNDINNTGTGAIDLTVSGGAGNFTFSWSNGAISEDLNGIPGGTYIVTITDGNGCTHIDTFMVSVIIGLQPAASSGLQVYPNPFSREVHLQALETLTDNIELLVTDLTGRKVWAGNQENLSQGQRVTIPMNEQAAGFYLLRVRIGDEVYSYKLEKH